MTIQSVSAAKKELRQKRDGMAEFFSDPHVDLKGKHVVVLGNSPALNEVDLELLDHPSIVTIGINRICRVYQPTAVLFTDPPIVTVEEPLYRAYDGKFFTWHGFGQQSPNSWILQERVQDLRYFLLTANTGAPDKWRWPKTAEDPLIRQGTTPPYALQLAVLSKAKSVSILGIDLSAADQAKNKKDTHFYGSAHTNKSWTCLECRAVGDMSMIIRRGGTAICRECGAHNRMHKFQSTGGGGWNPRHDKFFTPFPAWARSFGASAYNLSPYTDTPIHRANWAKLSVAQLREQANG